MPFEALVLSKHDSGLLRRLRRLIDASSRMQSACSQGRWCPTAAQAAGTTGAVLGDQCKPAHYSSMLRGPLAPFSCPGSQPELQQCGSSPQVGFRQDDIKKRQLLHNNRPIMIKGVDRHEHEDRRWGTCSSTQLQYFLLCSMWQCLMPSAARNSALTVHTQAPLGRGCRLQGGCYLLVKLEGLCSICCPD